MGLFCVGFSCLFPTPSIIFVGKGTVVSCVTLRVVFPATESGCSSQPCYLTVGFGVCSSQAWGHTDKGVGNSRCCPLAHRHPAGFQLPPSLFLEKLKPYTTESTPSRTVSGSWSSLWHDLEQLRTSKLMMYSTVEMAPYSAEKERTGEKAGNSR